MSAPVTERDSAVCIAESTGIPAERGTGVANGQTGTIPVHSAITQRERVQSWLQAATVYLTPPSVLTDSPASVAELAAYAKRADWTASQTGFLRGAGVAWFRLVGLPITVVCRYVEWIAQRPGRAIPVAVLVKVAALTTPGAWAVDNILTPVAHAAAWILL